MSDWIPIKIAEQAVAALQAENAYLKAEVERLTLLQVETLNERNKAEAEVERLTKREQGCLVNPSKVAQYLPKPTAAKEDAR